MGEATGMPQDARHNSINVPSILFALHKLHGNVIRRTSSGHSYGALPKGRTPLPYGEGVPEGLVNVTPNAGDFVS